MILHRYFDKYGMNSIRHLEFKVSIPSEFNDPFELLPVDTNKLTPHKIKTFLKDKKFQDNVYRIAKTEGKVKNKKEFKAKFSNKNLIVNHFLSDSYKDETWELFKSFKGASDEISHFMCFSSEEANDYDQILMWSHYGDKHKGIRIHFDPTKLRYSYFALEKISYSETRPELDTSLNLKGEQFLSQVKNVLSTKSIAWQYEKEYRLFITPKYCHPKIINGQELRFVKIPIESIIRIDLGLYFPNDIKSEMIQIVNNNLNHTEIFQADFHKEQYKLVYKKIN